MIAPIASDRIHGPDLAEARLIGLMLSRTAGAWSAEVELLHHGRPVSTTFSGIRHCMLDGSPAVEHDTVACVQVRPLPPSMRRDLRAGDDCLAVRFEFTSGTSLLVVCDDCRFDLLG